MIQPVLTWSGSWSITSWIYCGFNKAWNVGATFPASPGDKITGTMSLANNIWTITTADITKETKSTLNVSNSFAMGDKTSGGLNWAVFEHEAWNVSTCSGYPGSSPITYSNSTDVQQGGNAELTQFAPMINNNDGCGEDVSVLPGEVALYVSDTSNPASQVPFPGYNTISSLFTGSGKCLDITSITGGTPVLDTCVGDSGQEWIVSPQIGWSGYYQLTSMYTNDLGYEVPKCLDIVNNGTDNQLVMDNCANVSGQFWKVTPQVGRSGYYQLTSMLTGAGKCLDVVDSGADNQVTMDTCGNYSGQFWAITP